MTCEDKVAIVTGAAGKGMGRSIALTLAREGAKVVVNYRSSEEMARSVVEHIAARGGEVVTVQADVFTAEGCKKLVDATVEKFGRAAHPAVLDRPVQRGSRAVNLLARVCDAAAEIICARPGRTNRLSCPFRMPRVDVCFGWGL